MPFDRIGIDANGRLICRDGILSTCCDETPPGGCCPTPFFPVTSGDCGNRWKIRVTRYGVDNTTTAPAHDGIPATVAHWHALLGEFEGSIAGPEACTSCALVQLRTSLDTAGCATTTDQRTYDVVVFAARCFGNTGGQTRTTAPPFLEITNYDLTVTSGAFNRWQAVPNFGNCFREDPLTRPEDVRFRDSGIYTDIPGWTITVEQEWAIDQSGFGYWNMHAFGTSSLGETFDERIVTEFQFETIEPCTTPVPMEFQPCADMRYWVPAVPCPGTPLPPPPFPQSVYARVSALDSCGVVRIPSSQVCVRVDPTSPQLPNCPPGSYCLDVPIDPDIRECCQCVPGCQTIQLVRGELGACITDTFDGPSQPCCCAPDMQIRLLAAHGVHITPSFTEEYVLPAPIVGTVGAGIHCSNCLDFRVDGNPAGSAPFNLDPGCGWRNNPMGVPWEIDGMHVNAQGGWRYGCRQQDLPPGGTLVSFSATRNCFEYHYHAEWTYQTGILERFIHDAIFELVSSSGNCGGGCGPQILPGKGIAAATTGGCAGCGKGGGL